MYDLKWWHYFFNILRPFGYRACKEDEIIFVLDRYGSFKYYIINSGTMIWPLTKRSFHRFSLETFKIDIDLILLTKENIRLKHNSIFNLKISTSRYLIHNYAHRLIHHKKDDKLKWHVK